MIYKLQGAFDKKRNVYEFRMWMSYKPMERTQMRGMINLE